MTEDYGQRVARELRTGLAVMNDWAARVEEEPGKALAYLTWLGLALAQNCQGLTEDVVTVGENGESLFFSMDGALFRSNGSVVTLSREYFTVLSLPTDEDAMS